MKRTTFLAAAWSALTLGTIARASAAEVAISLPTATGTIDGSLTLAAKLPAPVVLIVAGSGPTDRNGNAGALRPDTYRLLAAALAAGGISCVRYDKRGISASAAAGPSEADVRFDDYAGDAAGWLRLLRRDARFTAIELAGHSEGSLVGTIALQNAPGDAFVSLEGAGRPAAQVLREQLRPKLSAALYAQAVAIVEQLEHGRTVPDPPPELAALFRESVQPYLISWFRYDPAREIAKLRVPATIVQGTADVQVTMTDANDLKRAAPAAKLIVVEGMNHVLKYAPDTSTPEAILQGYRDASLPIDPHAVEAVAAFAR